jgi:8-oxo-dGTP pyrophosphatase MutT (NUDIX family)
MSQLELHPIQAKVLTSLAKNSPATFAQLNTDNLSTDWFSYHLKYLYKHGLIEKNEHKNYRLTQSGKKLALQFDPNTISLNAAQRLSVLLIVKSAEKLLIQQRSSEPFKDFWEFPTHRIGFGESPLVAAQNLLKKEANLSGTFTFMGVLHKVEKTPDSETFDDKYYLVYEVTYVVGELAPTFEFGTNHWLNQKDFLAKEHIHYDVPSTFLIDRNGPSQLEEVSGNIQNY